MTKKHIITVALNTQQYNLLQEYMSKRLITIKGRALVDALVWAFNFLFSQDNRYNDKNKETCNE